MTAPWSRLQLGCYGALSLWCYLWLANVKWRCLGVCMQQLGLQRGDSRVTADSLQQLRRLHRARPLQQLWLQWTDAAAAA